MKKNIEKYCTGYIKIYYMNTNIDEKIIIL